MDIINENQQKFEPYAAMVDKAYENLNSEFLTTKMLIVKLKIMYKMMKQVN